MIGPIREKTAYKKESEFDRNKKTVLMLMVLSFLVPIFIMVAAYYMKGIYPGGPNTVLTLDLRSQYMPFFASLRYLGDPDNSIFLNMSGALGNNFWGFAYYIFSPFTWITVLFPLEALPTALYLTFLFRIGLCGSCFCIFLLYRYDDNSHYLGKFLLSCCYALMAYNIGYSINIMWLDGVYMLPLILIGSERILTKNKHNVFIVTITLSMIFNYYITCMSLIFVVFYTSIRLIETGSWNTKRIFGFIRSGLIALGVSCSVVLPGIIALRDGKMEEGTGEVASFFRYNLFEVLGQLLSGKYDTVYFDGLPFLFCGTGTILLIIVFFISKRCSKKTKIAYGAVIAFYIVAMCVTPIDIAMHGFKRPSCFEVRYAFSFCCLLLTVAYQGLDVVKDIRDKYKINSKIFDVLCTGFILVELYMNASIIIAGLMIELNYTTTTEYEMVLDDKLNLLGLINDDSFYRISNDTAYTYNDGAWLGYNGFGYFSSCYNLKVMDYFGHLGECQSYHIYEDHDRTPLIESLFGAKYKFSYVGNREADEEIGTSGFFTLSKNKDALALGYMTEINEGTYAPEVSTNAFENQNNMAKELSGIDDDVFVEINKHDYEIVNSEGYAKQVRFWVEAEEKAPVWLYIEKGEAKGTQQEAYGDVKSTGVLLINGGEYGKYRSDDTGSTYTIYLGEYDAGERIDIELKDQDGFGELHVDYLDRYAYDNVIENLKLHQMQIKKHSNGRFIGSIDAGTGGTMLLTLPVMDGWRVKVDGEKIIPGSYRGVLLTVDLSAGEHNIDIYFVSPGLIIGIIVMIISIIAGSGKCLSVVQTREG